MSESRTAITQDSGARKGLPITTGVLDYFPAALAYVAHVSKYGNDKHNPGEPLHHARGKSMDHADCIVRHIIDRGTKDPDGIRHSGYIAWRALALLQEELEREEGAALPRGACLPEPAETPYSEPRPASHCPECGGLFGFHTAECSVWGDREVPEQAETQQKLPAWNEGWKCPRCGGTKCYQFVEPGNITAVLEGRIKPWCSGCLSDMERA